MTARSAHLFVYGTLMSTVSGKLGRGQRERLQRESRSRGPATVLGRLYDLGRYPGLVLSDRDGDLVHGELVELADAEPSLRWLDSYEGLVPGQHTHGEYERVTCVTRLAAGEPLQAFVYVYRQSLIGKRWLESGRWSATEPSH